MLYELFKDGGVSFMLVPQLGYAIGAGLRAVRVTPESEKVKDAIRADVFLTCGLVLANDIGTRISAPVGKVRFTGK